VAGFILPATSETSIPLWLDSFYQPAPHPCGCIYPLSHLRNLMPAALPSPTPKSTIRKKVIFLQVLQVLQVLQELYEAPEAHWKLTGSNLKQTIAKLIFIKHLKHLKYMKKTFFFLMTLSTI